MSIILIQRVDLALHASAARQVDDRIASGRKDIAGAQHVGSAEEHQAVAIGVRRGHVINHHRLAVEEEILAGQEVFVVGPSGFGNLGLIAGGRRGHAVQHVGLRDDSGRTNRLARHAELGHFRVSAGVIVVDVRVDDPANRPVG